MATSPYPTTQAFAGGFIISAGCILFRIIDVDGDASDNSGSCPIGNVQINTVNDRHRSPSTENASTIDSIIGISTPNEVDQTSTVTPNPSTSSSTSQPPAPTQHSLNVKSNSKVQVCILHHLKGDEWLLPKGRKDRGETISSAAIRETYEETGYACHLWPLRMPTRAPPPGISGNESHKVELVDGLTEPIAVTTRELTPPLGVKLIFWFIALADGGGRVKEEGTQMPNESFESVFVDAEAAVERLTFENDREVMRVAVGIVRDNLNMTSVLG